MSPHITEELPRLLTGEADRDEVLAAAEHLRGCDDCRQELVSAVVAHASIMSARRFAPELVTGSEPARLSRAVVPTARPAHPLPDLSAMFDTVRDEAATHSRPHRRRVLAGVAAAVVLAGGGIAAGLAATSSGGPSTTDVALVGHGRTVATAALSGGDHMRIDASSLPRLDTGRHYEVWLTDTRGNMQPVGWIGADERADISVPPAIMTSYQAIAVSVQGLHQTGFSGDIVARGDYA